MGHALPSATQLDIFLSFSRDNTPSMERIKADLEAHGYRVWVDLDQHRRGTPQWTHAVEQAIAEASQFVVILSPSAKESIWVTDEMEAARQQHKPMWGLLVDGTPHAALPTTFKTLPYFDLREEADYPAALHDLLSALAAPSDADPLYLRETEAPPPLPPLSPADAQAMQFLLGALGLPSDPAPPTSADGQAAMHWLEGLASGHVRPKPRPRAPFARWLDVVPRLHLVWVPLFILAAAGATGAMPAHDRVTLVYLVLVTGGAWLAGVIADRLMAHSRLGDTLNIALRVVMAAVAYLINLLIVLAVPFHVLTAGVYVLAFGLSLLFTFDRDEPRAPYLSPGVFGLLLLTYAFLL